MKIIVLNEGKKQSSGIRLFLPFKLLKVKNKLYDEIKNTYFFKEFCIVNETITKNFMKFGIKPILIVSKKELYMIFIDFLVFKIKLFGNYIRKKIKLDEEERKIKEEKIRKRKLEIEKEQLLQKQLETDKYFYVRFDNYDYDYENDYDYGSSFIMKIERDMKAIDFLKKILPQAIENNEIYFLTIKDLQKYKTSAFKKGKNVIGASYK